MWIIVLLLATLFPAGQPADFNSVNDIMKAKGTPGQILNTRGFRSPGDGGGTQYKVITEAELGKVPTARWAADPVVDSRSVIPMANGVYAVYAGTAPHDPRRFGLVSGFENTENYQLASENRNAIELALEWGDCQIPKGQYLVLNILIPDNRKFQMDKEAELVLLAQAFNRGLEEECTLNAGENRLIPDSTMHRKSALNVRLHKVSDSCPRFRVMNPAVLLVENMISEESYDNNIIIEGGKINGNAPNQTWGREIWTDDFGVRMKKYNRTFGILLYSAHKIGIRNVSFVDTAEDCVYMRGRGGNDDRLGKTPCRDIEITGCEVERTGRGAFVCTNGYNITISDNVIRYNGFGAYSHYRAVWKTDPKRFGRNPLPDYPEAWPLWPGRWKKTVAYTGEATYFDSGGINFEANNTDDRTENLVVTGNKVENNFSKGIQAYLFRNNNQRPGDVLIDNNIITSVDSSKNQILDITGSTNDDMRAISVTISNNKIYAARPRSSGFSYDKSARIGGLTGAIVFNNEFHLTDEVKDGGVFFDRLENCSVISNYFGEGNKAIFRARKGVTWEKNQVEYNKFGGGMEFSADKATRERGMDDESFFENNEYLFGSEKKIRYSKNDGEK